MKKKNIMIIAAAAIVLCLAIGGTLAYFTDKTEEAQNTFTIGKVDVELTETSEDGTPKVLEEGMGFSYENCMPGSSFDKKPVVTLAEDSQPAWVFSEIIVNDAAALNKMIASANADEYKNEEKKLATDNLAEVFLNDFAFSADDAAGAFSVTEDDGTVSFHMVYLTDADGDGVMTAGETMTLFTGVTVPAKLDASLAVLAETLKENDSSISLNIKAYAIQAENVDSVKTAYEQFFDPSSYLKD